MFFHYLFWSPLGPKMFRTLSASMHRFSKWSFTHLYWFDIFERFIIVLAWFFLKSHSLFRLFEADWVLAISRCLSSADLALADISWSGVPFRASGSTLCVVDAMNNSDHSEHTRSTRTVGNRTCMSPHNLCIGIKISQNILFPAEGRLGIILYWYQGQSAAKFTHVWISWIIRGVSH